MMENNEEPPELAAKPDIMNDPTFDTNTTTKGKGMEDLDTCRICRGEGSKEEPLFYPCKCSGSIKFVHQNCLMEWLSHSQKKHCELCKTPFRFTKLYSPHMPKSVPLLVFTRQAIVHAYKSLLSWWRLQLVLFVWGACLPYCMRSVWRALFWFGDGGWITWQEVELRSKVAAERYMDKLAATGTTPANLNQLTSKDAAASAVVSHITNTVPSILQPISSTSNFFSGGPLLFRLGRKIARSMVSRASNETIAAALHQISRNVTARPRLETHSSLLSNSTFLKTLTRFPHVNGILIDTFEGQIITLSIVVAFILVFLIREWVVQQQPVLAMAANAAAQEAQAEEVPEEVPEEAPAEHIPEDPLWDMEMVQNPPQAEQAESSTTNAETNPLWNVEPGPVPLRMPAGAKPSLQERLRWLDDHGFPRDLLDLPEATGDGDEEVKMNSATDRHAAELEDSDMDETTQPDISRPESRPSMPTRETIGRAAEIRRVLEENSVDVRDRHSSINIFTDIWARAGNRPSEVLRIIDREGRNEELSWIVTAMKRVEGKLATGDPIDERHADHEQPTTDENTSPLNRIIGDRSATSSSSSPKVSAYRHDSLDSHTIPVLESNAILESTTGSQPSISAELSQGSEDSTQNSDHLAFGLRDISNQQLDGAIDDSVFQKDDSDSSFVVLSGESEQNAPTNELTEENPFSPIPNLDSQPSSSTEPNLGENVSIGDMLADLVDQEQNLAGGTLEEHEALLREANDVPSFNEQGTVPEPNPPRSFSDRIIDWLWGEPPPMAARPNLQDADDEHIVHQVEEEAPFVPMAQGRPVFEPEAQPDQNPAPAVQDADVVAAAAEAGIDANGAEAVEDAEDLEGIMELVGLHGPLFGLIQNAIFCSVIVAITVALGVWVPYISGKVFLIFLANPFSLLLKMPLRWASTTADVLVDLCIFSAGYSFYWTDTAISYVCRPVTRFIPTIAMIHEQSTLAATAYQYAESALDRLAGAVVATSGSFMESDVPTFSVVAHESLIDIKSGIYTSIKASFDTLQDFVNITSINEIVERVAHVGDLLKSTTAGFSDAVAAGITDMKVFAQSISLNKILQIDLNIPPRTAPLDFALAHWDPKDRALAIVLGYIFFGLIGIAYLKIGASIRGKNASGRVEGSIADALYQAGGVLKVILIITIEMIVFPLFCGLLLDGALLPLFGNATFLSRLNFGLEAPWTSLFIHWFVGTCYMFHFALFVAMCRKIMRSGVLYFIRDPDDPTFHPVRDVLERNLFTQLRKIVFSALVYGGLVMICLGGVVWGIYYAFDGVFPVHWSSNEPVLEFPVDLLFYNFLVPVAVKFFKPSNALNRVYGWWFRRCARALRLSHFLFNQKMEDEEGRHVRRTWQAVFDRKMGDPSKPVTNMEQQMIHENCQSEAYFLRDGRYVRAPASDQVRMPKGTHTFLEVDEYNHRVDKLEDREQGPHGSKNDQFTQVYIPPFFRLRISIFIFLIWLFAAITGVCTTILPLVLGRRIFASIAPSHLRMNDIYAFSIGIYILGSGIYALLLSSRGMAYLSGCFSTSPTYETRSLFRRIQSHLYRVLRVLYIYTSFTILLPALFAMLIQTYAVIPLHTYFGTVSDRHTIHIVQDWTLGVLYIQAIGRLILWNSPTRPADALRGIVRKGWLDPDARLATRAFIFPATALMLFLLAAPLVLGRIVNELYFPGEGEATTTLVYRYCAPALLGLGLLAVGLWMLKGAFQTWRGRIRDEVYLIGERLHNFGDSRRVGRAATGGRLDVRA